MDLAFFPMVATTMCGSGNTTECEFWAIEARAHASSLCELLLPGFWNLATWNEFLDS